MCLQIIYVQYMYKQYLALNCYLKMCLQIIYVQYMYKQYLALNNIQIWLVVEHNPTKTNYVLIIIIMIMSRY